MLQLKLIIQLIPLILELIKAIEAALPEGGKGKEKLSFVKETLTAAYPELDNMWALVQKVIDAAVVLFNTTGSFKTTK